MAGLGGLALASKVAKAGGLVFNDGSTQSAGSLEGTSIKSTGEGGGTKFLREDGDGTSSWQAAGGGNKSIVLLPMHDDTSAQIGHSSPKYWTTVELADAVTDDCQFQPWTIPDDFTSFTSIELLWATGNNTGNARFTFAATAITDGEETRGWGDNDSITEASYAAMGGSGWARCETDLSTLVDGITLTVGHELGIGMSRIGGSGSDTVNSLIRIFGIKIVYS